MQRIFFPLSKPKFVNEKEIIEGLRKIALKLAKKNRNIEEIYLFGSYAKSDANLYSDADILVILSEDRRKAMDRLDEFIWEFSGGPIPVDVLVNTRAEINLALKEGNLFFAHALKGIRLV